MKKTVTPLMEKVGNRVATRSRVRKQQHSAKSAQLCAWGKAVLDAEAAGIHALSKQLGPTFAAACRLLFACVGRVIVTGMGKSGHVANKIAATLASTGTPAFFVHPGEASHGDMGMVTQSDCLLVIAYSGETPEVAVLLPLIKRLQVPMVSITGAPCSTIATHADVHLDVHVDREACPLNLAPSTSTTVTLAMGDALALTLLRMRGFSQEDFAFSHPGGTLGRRLLTTVSDIMHQGQEIPAVPEDVSVAEALLEMTEKRLGLTAVLNASGQVTGLFTDGDLRRTLESDVPIHATPIHTVMTTQYKHVLSDCLVVEALNIMEKNTITSVLVIDQDGRLKGVVHLHDVIKSKIV